jgi:hypothetical protein
MTKVKADTGLAKVVHVADAEPVEVVINHGSLQGVKPGDRFLVFGIGPRLTDPDTGEDLGELELVRGRGEAVHVQDHLATIRSLERRQARPARRVIRETGHGPSIALFSLALGTSGSVVEEELAPETEVPFESVQRGDFAKPI